MLAGSPRLDLPEGQLLASAGNSVPTGRSDGVVRSQGPDGNGPTEPVALSQQSQTIGQPVAKSGPAALFSRVGQFTRNLTAPDPRARTSSAPAVFEVAASSTAPRHLPVPRPRESLLKLPRPNSQRQLPSVHSDQPLQPLVLTKIDDGKAGRASSRPTSLPGEIQSRLDNDAVRNAADNAVSELAPSRLRETRLRTVAPSGEPSTRKTADRFLNWSQFPSRLPR